MGTQSKTKEKSTTTGKETTTPTYQAYADPLATNLAQKMPEWMNTTMQGYGTESGYNPLQQNLWSAIGQNISDQYGVTGPAGQYAGTGYMDTLTPYYTKQQQYIEHALPQERNAYLQQLKNDFGPAWGTSGKALAAAGESYANWQAGKARELAQLEAYKSQAQERGMQYTAAYNPFSWAQQAIGYAGAPETATSEQQAAQQQQALGWVNPMMQLATMGYTFPQSTTTVGTQTSKGESAGKSAGMSCCFIMNEAGDLTQRVREVRDVWWKEGQGDVPTGYRKMAKWLVPLMRKMPIMHWLVRNVMTHPIAVALEKHNPALYPIGMFWIATWALYGRLSGGAHEGDKPFFTDVRGTVADI